MNVAHPDHKAFKDSLDPQVSRVVQVSRDQMAFQGKRVTKEIQVQQVGQENQARQVFQALWAQRDNVVNQAPEGNQE